MKREGSKRLFAEACRYLAGGVNSPVRAFKAVGGEPLFIVRGEGSKVYDVDGNEFIDYVCSWGPLILGHASPEVVGAVAEAAARGLSYGAPTELETELAKLIISAMPSIELVRFVNSGTEAVMSALRLARAFTGREKIVKFAGCYHGHWDGLLVRAGSGLATFGLPQCPGIPQGLAEQTIVLPYNSIEAVRQVFSAEGERIAAVIVEPIAGNMGVVLPRPGFLEELRHLTQEYGSLLIFDEVITGFRVARGGAQELFNIKPDLTCLGKIIGGGMPVGAYGGKREVMELLAPMGPVYQAGTLSGNPIAMTAGIKTLELLGRPGIYEELEAKAKQLESGLKEAAAAAGLPVHISRAASMLTVFFTRHPVEDYESALKCDTERYSRFFWGMLERGVYLPPSQFEAMFLSTAHSWEDIEKTLTAAATTFKEANFT